eukprot:TRINITY_DN19972_c0_g1_i2.p2 TRINITY_DN19972_c0_g1~~TRINITY_DN19972_c0_g1_i2.p2  ORF type:complete len:192 (-),score=46.25 TRINITY_DN19972_c0_g1_i2:11-586(-)
MPAKGNLQDGTLGRRTIGCVDLMTIPSNRIFNESIWKQQARDFEAHHMAERGLPLWQPWVTAPRLSATTTGSASLPTLHCAGPELEVGSSEPAARFREEDDGGAEGAVLRQQQPVGKPTAVDRREKLKGLARTLGIAMGCKQDFTAVQRQKAKPDRCPPLEQFYSFENMYRRPRTIGLAKSPTQIKMRSTF